MRFILTAVWLLLSPPAHAIAVCAMDISLAAALAEASDVVVVERSASGYAVVEVLKGELATKSTIAIHEPVITAPSPGPDGNVECPVVFRVPGAIALDEAPTVVLLSKVGDATYRVTHGGVFSLSQRSVVLNALSQLESSPGTSP